jgi:diguanylate cyclase (GGDEF)-like protein
LDNFKQTNDLYGHPAGDTLLKQFATELRAFFRSTDIVSRWGGDEFLVIIDCYAEEARERVEPVKKWVCGDYSIKVGGQTRKVSVSASVGLASWRAGDTADALIARADTAMYLEKARNRRQ